VTDSTTVVHSSGGNDFEWHPVKAANNLRKHGVTFEEAATVFEDEHALLLNDEVHSDEEDRFLLLGMSEGRRLLSVVHLERGIRLRIISARPAANVERREYDRERGVGV
jgi:uncharacterized DUF497 family protein